jgi:hypothetical protein
VGVDVMEFHEPALVAAMAARPYPRFDVTRFFFC